MINIYIRHVLTRACGLCNVVKDTRDISMTQLRPASHDDTYIQCILTTAELQKETAQGKK